MSAKIFVGALLVAALACGTCAAPRILDHVAYACDHEGCPAVLIAVAVVCVTASVPAWLEQVVAQSAGPTGDGDEH